MEIVKIYHGRGYDISTDAFLETKRPARKDVLLRLKLEVLGFLKSELMAALREDSAPG